MKLITNSHRIAEDRLPEIVRKAVDASSKWRSAVYPSTPGEYTRNRIDPDAVDYKIYDQVIGRSVTTRVRRKGELLYIERSELAVDAIAVALAAGLVEPQELYGVAQSVRQESGDTGFNN